MRGTRLRWKSGSGRCGASRGAKRRMVEGALREHFEKISRRPGLTLTTSMRAATCRDPLRISESCSIYVLHSSWTPIYTASRSSCPQEHWCRSWALCCSAFRVSKQAAQVSLLSLICSSLKRRRVDHVHNLQQSAGIALVASTLV